MSDNYLRWSATSDAYKKYSLPNIRISYSTTSSSSDSNTVYDYTLKDAQKLFDSVLLDYISSDYDITCNLIHDILNERTLPKTSIPQRAEDAFLELVSELDRDFIEDMGSSLDSYLRDKSYDIAERVLDEALQDEYSLDAYTTQGKLVEQIVASIDFSACYEIIDDIRHAPRTFEEHLRDIGMSIYDFL